MMINRGFLVKVGGYVNEGYSRYRSSSHSCDVGKEGGR